MLNDRKFFISTLLLILTIHLLQSQSLEEGFKNPPKNAQPKGYWCMVNGNFSLPQMTEELKEFKDKGIGTLDFWDVAGWVDPNGVVPAGPQFMSDKSVEAIAHSIREAGKLNIDIGLTISSSWNAGGDWVKPEEGVMGLFESSIKANGPTLISSKLPFPEIPEMHRNNKMLLQKGEDGLPTFYRDVAVLAIRFTKDSLISGMGDIIDVTEKVTNGTINWEVPKGEWVVTRYVCTGTGQPLMRPSPNSNGLMIDHFSAEATRMHINFFFEKLEAELGDLSKTALKYLYTDSYEANSAVWTVLMPQEFTKRRGYDMIPYLPVLSGFKFNDDETNTRFLHDYRHTLSDLIVENHYDLSRRMCEEKGIGFIAEAGGPGPPVHNCPFESISSLGACSNTRGEFWFDPMRDQEGIDLLQIIKGPASAAHLYNRPRVEAEAFTGTQIWQFGPGDLKSAADRAMCEGLTCFVYHTSPHIPPEAGKPGWVYNFGTIINTTRAWWPLSGAFHQYLGRSCFLLQQGHFVGDVLYYYGDEAPNFVPPKHINPSLGFGYDYDVTNSDIILNKLDVKDGRFVLPHGQNYKVLVLPADARMNPDVLARIEFMIAKGGVVVGQKPSKSYSLHESDVNDKQVQAIAKKLWKGNKWKNSYGKGLVYNEKKSYRDVMQDLGIICDFQTNLSNQDVTVDFIHRKSTEGDFYFIRNMTDKPITFEGTFRSVNGAPELWNPDIGSILTMPVFQSSEATTTLPLSLEPYESVFVVFRGLSSTKQITSVSLDETAVSLAGLSVKHNGLYASTEGAYELIASNGQKQLVNIDDIPEEVNITGAWEVRFPYGWGAPQSVMFDQLHSWTESEDDGIRHFSGVAVYHKSFTLSEKQVNEDLSLELDLGKVSKVARIYLNGHLLGTSWHAPYKLDISAAARAGNNNLIIEVANVMSNQMTGDARRELGDKRTHSNITKAPNAWMTDYKDHPLIESGLMGPVKVSFAKSLMR